MSHAERLREQYRQKRIANGTAQIGCEDMVMPPLAVPSATPDEQGSRE
jgi:hypothetical protein